MTVEDGKNVVRGEDLCLECARSGPTCCKSDASQRHLSFPLSDEEWKRMLPYADVAQEKFGVPEIRLSEPNSLEFIEAMTCIFPGEDRVLTRLFPEGGHHWRLKTGPDGACVFLGEAGCILPRDIRPWYCRLFPSWMNRGAVTIFLADECLIAQKAKTPASGLFLLNTSVNEVARLYAKLREDWGLPPASPNKNI